MSKFTYFTQVKKVVEPPKFCKKNNIKINQIFSLVNEIYNQRDTTGLSDKEKYIEIGQMIFTAQGPRENVLFSYYTLGNIEDESRILDARDEDIFLCFNCDICALDKTEAVGVYSKSKIQVLKNVVEELCEDIVTKTGVDFRLTPNATIYLPGHLLVTTRTHVPNYNTFLTFGVFQGYFALIEKFKEEGVEANCIWNGRTGSELYHSHCHFTDYKIPIVEYVKEKFKRLSQDTINIESVNFKNFGNTVRDYIILQSPDIKKLQGLCSNFIFNTQVFGREKYKKLTGCSVIANFVIINHENVNHYVIIFAIVNKYARGIKVENQSVFCVPSTHQIMISPSQIDLVKKNEIKIIEHVNTKLFYKLDMVDKDDFNYIYIEEQPHDEKQFAENIITLHKSLLNPKFKSAPSFLLKAEILQYILGKGFNLNQEVIAENFMKILRNYDCFEDKKKCDEVQFGFFKTILTCVFLTYNKIEKGQIIRTSSKAAGLQRFAQKASMFKYAEFVRPSLDIKQCTWLKGDYLHSVLIESIGDTIMYTPIEELNKIVLAENVRIGDKSAFGYNLKANLNFIKNFEVLIKIQKINNNERLRSFIHELEAGKLVNTIRKCCMNFMLTFGKFVCAGSLPDPNSPNYDLCDGSSDQTGYIFVEYISPSNTFDSMLRNKIDIVPFFSCVSQVLSAVLFSNQYYGFTHYDLHLGNILLVPIDSCISNDVMKTNYHLKNVTLENICFQYYPVIIDYGRTYVKGMDKNDIYYDKSLAHYYGVTSFKSNQVFDLWTFFVNLLFNICAFQPDFILQTNNQNMVEIYASSGLKRYIKVILKHFYFFFTQSGKKVTDFYNSSDDDVEILYDEIVKVCNYMIVLPTTTRNNDKYKMMLNYFAKGLFRNIYDKLGHKYVWNLPERFTNSVDIDSLLNDLIDMIRDTTNNIEKDFKDVYGYDLSKSEVFDVKYEN